MKKLLFLTTLTLLLLSSCRNYNALQKTTDYDYKYEAAKQAYAAGHYTRAYQLLDELILIMKGTSNAEECLFMDAMCYYNIRDYETATLHFDRYYKSYPKGIYTELARFYSGKSSFLQSQKEYESAQLYYNLGNYVGNCTNGGSNYEACIITAENALKSYPYTNLREDLYMMILRARYHLASNSVDEKANERFTQTTDEYWGFKNEFPDSKYINEADRIFCEIEPPPLLFSIRRGP